MNENPLTPLPLSQTRGLSRSVLLLGGQIIFGIGVKDHPSYKTMSSLIKDVLAVLLMVYKYIHVYFLSAIDCN